METSTTQDLRHRRPRRRTRRRLVALAAAPALVAGVAVTALATHGDAAVVTANGVRVSGSAAPTAAAPGTTITLTTKVRSSAARTVLVDVELYGPDGARTAQKFWTSQALTAGRTRTWSTTVRLPATARAGTYQVRVGVFGNGWSPLLAWNGDAARVSVGAAPTPAPTTPAPTSAPAPTPTTSAGTPTATGPTATPTSAVPTGTATVPPAPTTTTAPSGGTAPAHFSLVAPGGTLPSSAQCAAWVRAVPAPAEVKGVNRTANATQGRPVAGATGLRARVDGAFTGTTEQILRWTACKWGVDEDFVKAQAAVESWWRTDTKGDLGSDPARCAPGHGLGVDGTAGTCPESWGLLQVRYPYNQPAFPDAISSTAFNADWAYSSWRSCYVGELTWLNDVERGSQYAAGDAWGCAGVWFSGRWHTTAAEDYITRVRGYLDQRIWETANFRQP